MAVNEEKSPYDVPEETPSSMICQVGSGLVHLNFQSRDQRA